MNKKFISIIWWYHQQIFTFEREQNYHMLPIEVMQEEWYSCEIFAIDSQIKIEDDPNFIEGTKVIYYKNIFQYLHYLWKNRKSIMYSNSLTIKTLLLWCIWEKTIFYPHSYPFWSGKIKSTVITFFYIFFEKIRINNIDEFTEVEKIKKWLAYICPLPVSKKFLYEDTKNRKGWVWIGNLTSIKNPEFLIEVCKMLQKKQIDFQIDIIWEDRYKKHGKNFQNLIEEHNLEKYIKILGFLPHKEIEKKLRKSYIYINTSISEWQCLAVYEGALSWNVLCLPDILSFLSVFWENAFYHNTSGELFENIMYLLDDGIDTRRIVKKNQEMILEKYSYEKIKQETKKMFLSLEK